MSGITPSLLSIAVSHGTSKAGFGFRNCHLKHVASLTKGTRHKKAGGLNHRLSLCRTRLLGQRLIVRWLAIRAGCRLRRGRRRAAGTAALGPAAGIHARGAVAHSGTCHTAAVDACHTAAVDGCVAATDAGPSGRLALARLLCHGGGTQQSEQSDGEREFLHRFLHMKEA
jgi:hypothetical protein